jgi:hypothetical protein
MSSGRIEAIVAALAGLTGAVVGGLALARAAGSRRIDDGRRRALVAMVMGLSGTALGGLVVATSAGGVGTGNGAIVAIVIGLIAAVESGYFDQSHMIRDFVEFSGMSPAAYLRGRSEETMFDLLVHAYPSNPGASRPA